MRVLLVNSIGSVAFEDNKYFSDLDPVEWFRSSEVNYDIDAWRSVTGDVSSVAQKESFLEPKRTFETYLDSIGLTKSIDEFSVQAASQTKRNWSREFTAEAVLDYIRQAYGGLKCVQ